MLSLGCILAITLLSSGCIEDQQHDTVNIVATFYPLAFFAQEIGGEHVHVTQLIPDNTELHAWQPTPSDILAANKADILLYNGAHLDHWFEKDLLPSIDQTGKIIVETTKDIELLQKSSEEDDMENRQDNNNDNELYDPHTWISPFIARQQAETIYNALIVKDPDNQDYYIQRWNQLQQKFLSTDDAFKEQLATKQNDAIIVTHAAFGYLAHRYGFRQYGVIGWAADEQPSALTIADLINKMAELEVYVVYIDPVYSDSYAKTLKNTIESKTNQPVQILRLYLMAGVIDGLGYFEQLEQNLQNLKIGLQAS
jgi:ABC-type Zn uptake system ZnuABC Zn-binding protein ZnuA